ncbi:MAG: insulinase family protein [Alphaproteobacteria bacterium]|nr:insulinase family protein [Alphaproteobacteria bacterium]
MKHILHTLLFAFTFVIAPVAHATVLDIEEVTSEGGITAWLVQDDSVPVIAMDFGFKGAGAAQDPQGKQGLARMLSNTMDEGAGSLNGQEFQEALREKAISLGFSASRDNFTGSLKTLTKNKARAFELAELALTKPRFDKEAVDRMREANISRIKSSLAGPDWKAARLINDRAFEDHAYALNSGGTLSSLQDITSKDLQKFHGRVIGKNNLHVAVAGDISAEELAVALDQIFGDLPDVEIEEPADHDITNQGSTYHFADDIPQTVIEMMQPGISRDDPDFQKAQVMNFILGSSGFGSRLTKEIRENRGLTYGIYSYFYNLDHLNGLSVSTSTANANVPEMLTLIKAEFEKIKAEPISDKELQDAKSYLIGSLPLSLTSTDKIAGLMNSIQLDGLPKDYLDTRNAEIEATTVEDIQAISQKILDPDAFVTVLVGKAEGWEENGLETTTIKKLPNVE